MPVEKHPGAKVTGGAINGSGSFVMRAERIRLWSRCSADRADGREAQRTRAPIQRLADVVSSYFRPAVVGVAILAFLACRSTARSAMAFALVSAISVLIIACPCALGLRHADVDHGWTGAAHRRVSLCATRKRSNAWSAWTPWWWTRRNADRGDRS